MKIYDKTTQTYKELVLKPGGDTLPIGSIVAFASDTIPNGWLLCDGSVVSRTTYSELFNAIGLNYVEDGVEWLDEERFPLPNAKGKTIVGKDSTDTDFSKLGKTIGEKTHTLTVSEMPSHNHLRDIENKIVNKGSGGAWSPSLKGTGNMTGEDNSTRNTGGGQAHNNLQPSLTLNFIIKAKNTVAIKGDVIQETGTASETNVYSAKAIDNKLKTNIVVGQEVATNEYEGGKQVFIKKIDIGSLPNAARKIVETGLTNVKVTKLHGIARDSSIQIPLPFVYTELPSCIGVMFVNGNIYINTGSDRTGLTGEITIYYTKNT
jgi:microcystin-dependent protein